MKAHITIINKKTSQVIQNRMAMSLQGDCTDLNNLISELKEIKNFVNGEANKLGLAYNEIETEIEINNKII